MALIKKAHRTTEVQEAYLELTRVTNAPRLCLIDPITPFMVEIDASEVGES